MTRVLMLLALAGALLAPAAQAHEVRPGYLELRQTAPDTYDLLFKLPALGEEFRLALYVTLPEGTQDVACAARAVRRGRLCRAAHDPARRRPRGAFDRDRRTVGDLHGRLVRIEDLAGTTQTDRLTPTRTSFVVKAAPGAGEVAITYLRLGIEHILGGVDHLLFVLALVILVREWRRVAITVTAFTIAHSITLAAATLGYVHVPAQPVEATIALSIVLVAVEIVNARRGRPSLTARWPWLVAFAFGLLHGFGFAGALSEVGLPQHAIPLALLFFNLGVEVGQLAFVALVIALAWWLPRAMARLSSSAGAGRRRASMWRRPISSGHSPPIG